MINHTLFPLMEIFISQFFQFYPEKEFGGKYLTETDYVNLNSSDSFTNGNNWMVFPPIPHSPLHSYIDLDGTPPHPPSSNHWLGTDSSARDVFARLLYGFRICMLFSLILAVISTLFGILIGGVQGYFGGLIDIVVQRMIEIWSSLSFSICGHSCGYDLFTQFYGSYSCPISFSVDWIILLHEGGVS